MRPIPGDARAEQTGFEVEQRSQVALSGPQAEPAVETAVSAKIRGSETRCAQSQSDAGDLVQEGAGLESERVGHAVPHAAGAIGSPPRIYG